MLERAKKTITAKNKSVKEKPKKIANIYID